jgi:calcium/proton exchanger cax
MTIVAQMNVSLLVLQFEEEEEEEKELTLVGCFVWLAIVTMLISFLSDIIMDCITEASTQLHVPTPFLTTIIVPIVGNAAEHASALIFAAKNRIEISLGVAVGEFLKVSCSRFQHAIPYFQTSRHVFLQMHFHAYPTYK